MQPYRMARRHLKRVFELDEVENQWDAYRPEVVIDRCNRGFWVGIVALEEPKASPVAFCFFIPTKNFVKIVRLCGSPIGKKILVKRLQERYEKCKIEIFVSELNVLLCKELSSLGFRSKLVQGLDGFDGADAIQFTWRRQLARKNSLYI